MRRSILLLLSAYPLSTFSRSLTRKDGRRDSCETISRYKFAGLMKLSLSIDFLAARRFTNRSIKIKSCRMFIECYGKNGRRKEERGERFCHQFPLFVLSEEIYIFMKEFPKISMIIRILYLRETISIEDYLWDK